MVAPIMQFIGLMLTAVAGIWLFKGVEKLMEVLGWLNWTWPAFLFSALILFIVGRKYGFKFGLR